MWKLSLCHESNARPAAHTHTQKSIFFPQLPTKKRSKAKSVLDGSVAYRSSWMLRYSNGHKQREGKRGKDGRESPECKAMFSRNVLPPVLSCNLTGNSPASCLTAERGLKEEGGRERCVENKMDLVREMGGGRVQLRK